MISCSTLQILDECESWVRCAERSRNRPGATAKAATRCDPAEADDVRTFGRGADLDIQGGALLRVFVNRGRRHWGSWTMIDVRDC
jgi:hypothetical protein